MVSVGDKAPDFRCPNRTRSGHALGPARAIVLVFYPKADTPGCTTQACGVRDHRADYEQAGAVVLGVSPDAPEKIAKFDAKYGLDFPLLGDEDHSVAEAYGVWVQKSMYGRTYMGMERSTFVLGADGKIKEILRKVKPAEHDELVLSALGASA